MSESKFTPAPWSLENDPSHFDTLSTVVAGNADVTKRPDRQLVVQVGGFASVEEQEANARLIAAAPELFEALTFLTNACDYTEGRSGTLVLLPKALEQARTALLKASPEKPDV